MPAVQIRPDRQTLLWSATWPPDVQLISKEFLKNAYQVDVTALQVLRNMSTTLPHTLD
jgi:ATP-dependent RNA helicase DDX5/DBP2